ncbi:oxidoreductase [Sulfodiicoccus acidiphilus]|uniref:Oxidoreductase n=1 Tax=Sulfodiicoccus acidiphilus TaxID=1670455 RepID=A0A348B0X1_9CREN|nr:oxidoreductase [Sulfodiicoccus acidiphilus]GGT99408.1 oxidoreductase [Sulfodiicoccus acidiphilus]
MIAILINLYYIVRRGLYFTFYVSYGVGNFGFTVNNFNFPFIVTILLVTSVTAFYSTRYMSKKFEEMGGGSWGTYYALYALFSISMLYAVLSVNLLEIYIFLEIALITSFLLILMYGYGDRRRISLLYFVWTHVGTLLTLSSIIIIGLTTGSMDIYNGTAYGLLNYSSIPYVGFVLGIGVVGMLIKSATFGFNIWLPYAHGEAPTPISVLLSPNMVGLGVFVITIYFYLFSALAPYAPIFIALALLTMIYGGINALAQRDFKRFLAYSTVSQMGYMLLGSSIAFAIGLKNSVLDLPLGILAALLIYVSHGLGKAVLFMSAGSGITELETRDIEKMGGLYLNSPLHSTLSFIGLLNILGLPPTVGLLSEILLIMSAGQLIGVYGVPVFVGVTAVLMVAIAISSGYGTYLFKKVYGGVLKVQKSLDIATVYSISMGLLAFFSVLFFFFPQLLFHGGPNPLSYFVQVVRGTDPVLPLIVFLPMLGSLLSILLPSGVKDTARGVLSTTLITTSAILAIYNLITVVGSPVPFYSPTKFQWTFSYFDFSSSLLQAILGVFVSVLSTLIAIYSIGYMKEDKVLRRYWAFFTIFVASMLSVIYSDNLILFLAGWEGTGLASYGLISYWLNDDEHNVVGDFDRQVLGIRNLSFPTTSGIRALVFTRIGDVAMLTGLGVLLFLSSGTQYSATTLLYPSPTGGLLRLLFTLPSHYPSFAWLVMLFIFLGGLSKSAQFPFTQWLLTAMTGPTPVSALIHAATMVNLGAMITFLFYPFMDLSSPQTALYMEIAAGVALFTAFYASFNALVAREQKLILANSTADQISLMIFSSSIGGALAYVTGNPTLLTAGIVAGLIQMIAHGIYKASLFMNAGYVIHFTENRYISSFRNLYKKIPAVFVLQLLAALNLANFPFLIGFWGHDVISNLTASTDLFYATVLLDLLGAVYIMRLVFKTFTWRNAEEGEEHETSKLMVVSPLILVAGSIVMGGLFYSFFSSISSAFSLTYSISSLDIASVAVGLIGIVVSVLAYYVAQIDLYKYSGVRGLLDFFYYGWYVNPFFDAIGLAYRKFSQSVFRYFETGVFDDLINYKLPSSITTAGSKIFGSIQTQVLRDYVAVYGAGIVVLFILFLILLVGVR